MKKASIIKYRCEDKRTLQQSLVFNFRLRSKIDPYNDGDPSLEELKELLDPPKKKVSLKEARQIIRQALRCGDE